ncbi:MAG TPA: hypothetical protein DCY88_05200 [Cyanobacteria bacterium UBA11372]|nr:hypothetical protein [Cyanobacteria bacterium UBA11372]
MFEDITAIGLLALGNVQGRGDALMRGRGDKGKTATVNLLIQSGRQTLGKEVPDADLETLLSLCVSVSPRLGVFLADAKIVQR